MSRRIGPAVALVIALVGLLGAPGIARAAGLDSVAMFSQTGDYIGGGQRYLWDSATATIKLTDSGSEVEVDVSGGTDPTGDGFTFDFAAPSGQSLADGTYANATRYPFEAATSPGLSIYGDGRGCDNDYGTFTIDDIGPGRLWLTFEQHCESPTAPALFGEIRIGEAASTTPETPEPSSVNWPDTYTDTAGTAVPITVVAGPDGADITSVAVTGADPGDFTIGYNTCTGAMLAAGGRCQTDVAFSPTADGSRSADLEIDDVSGATTTVPLTGDALPGDNYVTMVSQTGDWVGGGRDLLFDSLTGTVNLSGTLSGAQVDVLGGNDPTGDGYTFDFAPPANGQLADGVYDDGSLSISGDGAGCDNYYGTFTIEDIHVDASGNIDRLWLTYEQHCESPTAPALFGEIRIGEPPATTPESAEPETIAWPDTSPAGTSVPVTVVAGPDGANVASLQLTGADPSDFTLADGTCAEAVLAPAGRCQATVTFTPQAAGSDTADLEIADASGATSDVALSATATSVAPPPPPPPPALEPTTTILAASSPTSVFGTLVGYEAGVAAASGTPTGTIQYSIDGQAVGAPTAVESNGLAQEVLVGVLGVGDTVGAAYSGDSSFAASSASLTPTIEPAPTTLTLTSSANPSSAGSQVVITATVSDPSTGVTPVGSVQFSVNGSPVLAPEALDADGQAAIVAREPAGTYTIGATYHDDADPLPDFVDSAGSLVETVAQATTTSTSSTTVSSATAQTTTTSLTTSASATTTPSATGSTSSSSPTATVSSSAASGTVKATSTSTSTSPGGGRLPSYIIGSPAAEPNGRIRISVEGGAGGTFSATVTERTRSRTLGIGSGGVKLGPNRNGELIIVLDAAARRAIARGQTLHLRIEITYRPKDGRSSKTTLSMADGPAAARRLARTPRAVVRRAVVAAPSLRARR